MSLATLLANPDADWVYFVELGLGGSHLGFSYGRLNSPLIPGLPGSFTREILPFATNPLTVQTQINPLEIGNGEGTTFGTIDIAWEPEMGLDGLCWENWDAVWVKVYLGLGTDNYATFASQLIFSGTAEDITFDESKLSIVLRSQGSILDKPLQSNLYKGDNSDYEGGPTLKDVLKPIAVGTPKNITPVLVDAPDGPHGSARIYQVHDGPVKSIDAVYDGGIALYRDPADIDRSRAEDLFNWIPQAGVFKTDHTLGLFRLGAPATSTVTCDVTGAFDPGYATPPTTPGQVIQWMALRAGMWSGFIDAASFALLDTEAGGAVSYYSSGSEVTTIDAIRTIIKSVGGYAYVTRTGELTVGQMRYRTPSHAITYQSGQAVIVRLARARSPLAIWRMKFGYAKNWTVQKIDDAALPLEDHKLFVESEYRYKANEDPALLGTHPMAREVVNLSSFDSAFMANYEAGRQRALVVGTRFTYELELANYQWLIEVGQTITLTYPRFGLENGVDMFVLSVSESAVSGRTMLTVYG